MDVVYNCDDRYAGIFAVSVLSLFECSRDVAELTVYLIDNGIGAESLGRIQEIAAAYGREIRVIPMPDLEELVGMNVAVPESNTRIATCGRLFVTSLLPKNLDRVLYFDSDTIFMRSIAELWDMDLGENYAGMMADAMNCRYRSMLGIPAEGIYFNSGVVLINLKLWRREGMERRFMRYLQSQGGFVPWPDQGILNAVLDGRILCLPCAYNVQSTFYAFPYDTLLKVRQPLWFYSEEEVEEASRDPAMVHFTTNFLIPLRPWMRGCNHPCAAAYLRYRQMTPWRDEPLWDDNRSAVKKLFHSLYARYARIAPKWLYLRTTRFVYIDLFQLMYKVKRKKHALASRRCGR